ncbi:hypothetical protein B0H10DRAFT_1954358 [Mycena sp. CBHHK59/15]|nr:hypothetical protein B0H10DRAFT_1954358 [Mycena sp. CBHHK59/15]
MKWRSVMLISDAPHFWAISTCYIPRNTWHLVDPIYSTATLLCPNITMGSGRMKPPSRKAKKYPATQKASSSRNLLGTKENIPPNDYKHEYQKSQRKLRHAKDYQKKLQDALKQLKSRDRDSKKAADLAKHRNTDLQAAIDRLLSESNRRAGESKETLKALRKKNKALQQRVKRAAGVLSRSISRAKTRRQFCRVTEKGTSWTLASLAALTGHVSLARNQELFIDPRWIDLDDLKSWLHAKQLSFYLVEDQILQFIARFIARSWHGRSPLVKIFEFGLETRAPPSDLVVM